MFPRRQAGAPGLDGLALIRRALALEARPIWYDEAFSILVSIYVRFTQAENVRYFWNEGKAKEWILSYK